MDAYGARGVTEIDKVNAQGQVIERDFIIQGPPADYRSNDAPRTQAFGERYGYQEYSQEPRAYHEYAGYQAPGGYQDPGVYQDPRGYPDSRGSQDFRTSQDLRTYQDPRSYQETRGYVVTTYQDPASQDLGGYPDPRSQDPRAYREPQSQDLRGYPDPRGQDPRAYREPQSQDLREYPDPRGQDPRAYREPQSQDLREYPDPRGQDPRAYRQPQSQDLREYPDPRGQDPRAYQDSRSYQDPRAYEDPRGGQQQTRSYQDPQGYQEPRGYQESRGQQDPRYQDPQGYQEPRGYQESRGQQDPRYQDSREQEYRGQQDPRYQDSREQDPRYYEDPRGYRNEYPPQASTGATRGSAENGRAWTTSPGDYAESSAPAEQNGNSDPDYRKQQRNNSRASQEGMYNNSAASSSTPPCQLFGPTLLKESKEVEAMQELEGKTIGLFFASPSDRQCSDFLPYLTKAYSRSLVSMNVEIVWVPIDTEQKEFAKFSRRQPWLSLPREVALSAIGRRLIRKSRQEEVPHLVFMDQSGRMLSREGVKRIRSDNGCRNFPWTNKTFRDAIGTDFLRGREMVTIDSFEGKLIVILFASEEQSSLWYGPGNSFASILAKQYRACLRRGHDFEVIFCSADGNSKAFNRQYKEIVDNTSSNPWLAIPFADSGRRKALAFTLRVTKSPQLVIVDSEGRILNADATADVSKDPNGNKFPWARPLVKELKAGWDTGAPRHHVAVCCLVESFTHSQQEEVTAQLEIVSQRHHDSSHEGNEEPMYTFFAARRNSEEAQKLRKICNLPRASYMASMDKDDMTPPASENGFSQKRAKEDGAGRDDPDFPPRETIRVTEDPFMVGVPDTQQTLPPLDKMPPIDEETSNRFEVRNSNEVREWQVEVDRSMGGHLGIALNTTSLLIDRVTETGLIRDFNNENPDSSLLAGDQVVQVNGKSEPRDVIMECKKSQVLVFTLQRRQEAPQKEKTEKADGTVPKAWLVFFDIKEAHILYSTLETRISADAVEEFIEDCEQGRHKSSKIKRDTAAIDTNPCRSCTRMDWLQSFLGGSKSKKRSGSRGRSSSRKGGGAGSDEWGFIGGL